MDIEPRQAELVSYGTPEAVERNYEETTQTQEPQVIETSPPEVVESTPAQVEAPASEEVVTSEEAPSEVSEQEKVFREMFEKTFGIPPEAMKEQLQQVEAEKVRNQAEKELRRLQDSWGVDDNGLSQRFELINKKMQELPEAARTALDNYEGINLIWNSIVAEQGIPNAAQLPNYERNSIVTPQQQRPMFTRAELKAMPQDEYRRRNDEILYAYQNNLVV